MRRLNYKLAAGLIVGGAVLGAGVHVLHGVQLKRGAGSLLQNSAKAEKAGDVEEAVRSLAEYLMFEPDDVEARARSGLLREQIARTLDDHLAALATMEVVLRRDPNRPELRRKAVDVAMDLGRFEDARAHLLILLGRETPEVKAGDPTPGPEDGELTSLVGRCFVAARSYEQARAWYDQAIRSDPSRVEAYVACATLLREKLDEPDAADRLMDAKTVDGGLIAQNPNSVRAFVERGEYRRRLAMPGVEADVQKALELDPEDVAARLLAAAWAIDPGNPSHDFKAARDQIKAAQAKSPEDERIYRTLALVETRDGRPEEAVEALKKGIENVAEGETRLQMRWNLADILIQQGRTEDARAEVGRLRDEKITPELARYIEARAQMADGRWLDAIREFEAVRPTLLKDPGVATELEVLLARCYEQLGLGEKSLDAYRRAVDQDPRSTAARLGLATRLSLEGLLDEAILECRKADLSDPSVQLLQARLLVRKNVALPPASRDWREIDRLLSQVSEALPDSAELSIVRGQSLAARGKLDEAITLILEARDQNRDEVDLWTFLAGLESLRTLDAGNAVLDEAETALGDRVELRMARVELAARADVADRAATLKTLEDGAATLEGADRVKLLQSLASAYRLVGDDDGATRIFERIAAAEPNDLASRAALFDEAYAIGDRERMRQALEQIETLERSLKLTGGFYGDFARARYLMSATSPTAADGTAGKLDRATLLEARALLAKVVDARSRWGGGRLMLANVDDQLGQVEDAITGYRLAIDLGAGGPEVVERTAELLRSRNRTVEADTVLQSFAKADPTFGGLDSLRRLASVIASEAGDPARALVLARATYSADSKDPDDHRRYGLLLWQANQKSEAREAYRRAVEVGPADPESWVAWVGCLVAMGDKAGAEAAVEQARAKVAPDRLPLTLARCYQILGRLDEAKVQLDQALAAHPDDEQTLKMAANLGLASGRTREAELLLKRQLDGLGEKPEEAAYVRGNLAMLMAARGNHQEALRARDLVGLGRDDQPIRIEDGESVASLRAKAKVLALQRGHRARLDAISVLEQLVGRRAATSNDQFLLAQLYASETVSDAKAWSRYREQIESLLAADGKNPQYLAHYILRLLDQKQVAAAATWLARLKAVAPGTPQTVDLEARVLVAMGKSDQATTMLLEFATRNPSQRSAVAMLLEGLGQPGPAERLYNQIVASAERPETVFVLASFYARHDRMAEALDLCEKAWTTCPPEVVSNACVQLHFLGTSYDEAQLQKVTRWVEEAAAKAPDRLELQFDLANLLIFQRKMAEAEVILRKLQAKLPGTSGPPNNLAWLLAIQKTKPEEASRLIDEAIVIDGPVSDLLDTRALVHLAAGRPEAAIQDLGDAIAVGPSADKYFHLAVAYQTANRPDDAKEAFREAIDRGLKAESVHPLERPGYFNLLKVVDAR